MENTNHTDILKQNIKSDGNIGVRIKVAIISDTMDRRPEKVLATKRLVQNLLKYPELEIYLIHYKKMLDEPLYQEVHEIIIPRYSLPFGSQFVSFVIFCLKTKEKFDIVHWLVPRIFPFFWLFPAKKKIIMAHDGYIGVWTLANTIFWFTIRFFSRYIDAIIGVTEYAKKEIMRTYHIPESKAFTIYNGLDPEFHPVPEITAREVLKKYNIYTDKYLLYVGGLVTHKNVPRLILAYDLLRKREPAVKEKLIIIGKASLGAEEIKNVVKEAEYSKDIIFISYVPPVDIPAFYSLATALILVSLNEGFGMPIAEGMACGTPVITSNMSAMPEAGGGAAILVDPYNIEDIMMAMKRIVGDESLRKQLIAKGLERVKTFSWKRYAEESLKIYKKTLNYK
ncbi:MAG: glycosyltransferase family 1 protein [Candidatus Paceibacterota bacterium]|jgi:glycosyltransferase involved in cell wall biosynthesis